jgi:hypothetical protein
MRKKISGFIFWPPRLLSVLFIILLAWLSTGNLSVKMGWEQFLTNMFLYNIPTLIYMAILLISWEIEIVGGLAYLLTGAGYSYYAGSLAGTKPWFPEIPWNLSIIIPLLLIGILFVINWFWKRKIKADERKIRPF